MTALIKVRNAVTSISNHSPLRWVVLTLIAAAVIATAAYSYRKIDNELTAVALSRREAVAQLMAAILTEKIGRSIDVAVSLSTRVRFKNLVANNKWDEAIEILREVPNDFPYIERLILTDIRGTLKADVPALPGVREVNFAYREWFQGVSRNWRPYVSPLYMRAAAPQINVFAISVPVKNTDGQVTGILVLQIRIEKLIARFAEIDLGPKATFYIVDSKGRMAFHSKHWDRKEIIDLSEDPIVQKLRRGEQGVEIGFDAVEQEESITAYASMPDHGWGVIVQQAVRSSGLAARDSQLRQLLAGYGLILLLGAAIVILTLRIANARHKAENDRQMKTDLEQRVIARTTELQAANRELEAFSYSVSHDLRAPLRAINGFNQAVMEDYADRLDDKGKEYLSRVRAATQHMGHLIDAILALSRVTRAEMLRKTVDLSALAPDVLAELQKGEPARRVEWRIEPGLVAQGDVQLLRIVLVNLLGNAWKYSAHQPQPLIEFGTMRDDHGATEFFVRDNGAGFDMTYAGKLFGAFQRLHPANEFPGTGVGLATVQRIVHRHGGRVWAEGAVGKGATFYFTLPR